MGKKNVSINVGHTGQSDMKIAQCKYIVLHCRMWKILWNEIIILRFCIQKHYIIASILFFVQIWGKFTV